jgi:hypothetical protein
MLYSPFKQTKPLGHIGFRGPAVTLEVKVQVGPVKPGWQMHANKLDKTETHLPPLAHGVPVQLEVKICRFCK